MFKFLCKPKAQSTFEYLILLIIIVGALLAGQVYIKRSVQGRLKASADDIGEQYSPGNTNVARRVESSSTADETSENGITRSEINTSPEIYRVTEGMAIADVGQEYWGSCGGTQPPGAYVFSCSECTSCMCRFLKVCPRCVTGPCPCMMCG